MQYWVSLHNESESSISVNDYMYVKTEEVVEKYTWVKVFKDYLEILIEKHWWKYW